MPTAMLNADEIADAFAFIDDWEERYRYVIELGRALDPFPEALKTDATKVEGCASQVWLATGEKGGRFAVAGDSDAIIVKGLVAILVAYYEGRPVEEVSRLDVENFLKSLGLDEHLTPQRSNGIHAMVRRIRADGSRLAAEVPA